MAGVLSVTLIATATTASARTSCKDFATQKAAQKWYEQRKKAGQTGWKALDRDRDGIACENN